jgi:hypothetical protein
MECLKLPLTYTRALTDAEELKGVGDRNNDPIVSTFMPTSEK